MAKGAYLTTHELMTMLAILRLGKEAYGVPICREIESHSGREVAVSGIYSALERLEQRGMVVAELGEATPQRGGRAKTYFQLTARGLHEVKASKMALSSLWGNLSGLSWKTA